jgi:6-phosphogluconate dehydrogenase
MEKHNIGLIGLGPMGQNLILNMEDKGYSIAVYNRTGSKTDDFANGSAKGKNIFPTYSLEEFVNSLENPRKVVLLVKQGKPVDDLIERLIPLLDKGDLIIDAGNSYFKDTIRRNGELSEKGLFFIGTGVSGGEEGALRGPAIMPGGQREAYDLVEDLFKKIAAKAHDGVPCVSYVGPDGAGHFVKMVHNGIEYGDMELLGECVWVFKNALCMSSGEIAQIMTGWDTNDDILRSYLVEITGDSMKERDKTTGEYLVDRIADITRMKGTGTWTVQSALELLVPIPSITAAVFSREMSQDKELRLGVSKTLSVSKEDYVGEKEQFVQIAHDALYLAKVSSYAQGMALLQAGSKEYGWGLNLGEIVQGWRSGCIIRAQFLDEVTKVYEDNPELPNLLCAPRFAGAVKQHLNKLVDFIDIAHQVGVPTPVMSSACDYILQLSSPIMISAQVSALQRDYFGAHGYFKLEGLDNPAVMATKEGKMIEFHTEWMLDERPETEVTG